LKVARNFRLCQCRIKAIKSIPAPNAPALRRVEPGHFRLEFAAQLCGFLGRQPIGHLLKDLSVETDMIGILPEGLGGPRLGEQGAARSGTSASRGARS
jgi:hypothetical protein